MSIGQKLAAAREDAGLTVEQVAELTRTRRTIVQAIEDDDFSPCGGDFYARGHIRNIAKAVGADAEPLVAEFDASRAAPAPRPTEIFESETAARPERRGPNWSAAMAAALVLVLAYGVAQAVTGDSKGRDTTTAATPTAKSPGANAPSSSASTPANPSAVAQAPRDRVTVVVRASDRCWVQATTASGEELFQGLLQAGEDKTFSDKQRVKLIVGNAGAIALTVNGTDVGVPGTPGQVARVQFGPKDPAAG